MASGYEEKNARVEVEKTLASLSSTILEINRELKTIKALVSSNGELQRSMCNTMDKLSEEAKDLGIDVNSITDVDQDLFRISTEPISSVEKLISASMNQ